MCFICGVKSDQRHHGRKDEPNTPLSGIAQQLHTKAPPPGYVQIIASIASTSSNSPVKVVPNTAATPVGLHNEGIEYQVKDVADRNVGMLKVPTF